MIRLRIHAYAGVGSIAPFQTLANVDQAEGQAQEFGEQDAHLASFGRIDARERADGIEAVEQEVRVHLGFQRFQFSVASEDACLSRLRFGATRIFHGNEDIVKGDRKQIEKDSDGIDGVHLRTELGLDGFELLGAENRVGEQGANVSPNEADEHGSDQVRQQQPHESDSAQGSCATRVPGEKAKKSVKQKHGHSDGGCLPPNEAPSRREYVDGRGNERDPSKQIEAQAAAREQWMHWTSLVFDFQPAKDDSTGDHQRLEITACSVIDAGGPRFVLDAAENGRATERDLPPDGYTKFHAAEDNGNRQGGLISLDVRLDRKSVV